MSQSSLKKMLSKMGGMISKIHSVQSSAKYALSVEPTLALVPPGICQLENSFVDLKLIERHEVSSTTSILRFELKDKKAPLNLSTCACILAKADLPSYEGKEEAVIRPYTPISTNALMGCFDLLVKNYGDHGRMSTHLCTMPVGGKIGFKHIDFNVKIQAPFKKRFIGMLVGGTGITPMIQALHAILGDVESDTEVSMIYGSRVSSDILGKKMLDGWMGQEKYAKRFSVTHVLSGEDENSSWKGERGFIRKEHIEKLFPKPDAGDEIMIFVCGPPIMYELFCGPRNETELTGILKEMGYKKEQVFKF